MRCVIVDLDRTLLHTDKTISGYTVDILRKCHDKGIFVMAATARPERTILQYHRAVCFDAAVTMNGARIILPDRVIENSISHISGRRILSGLADLPGVIISVETDEGIFSSADIPEWDTVYWDGFPELPAGILYKVLASSREIAPEGQLEKILPDDVYYTVANGYLVQIMSREATKWKGIRAMLEAFGSPVNEAVYFGDDNDDIELIRNCGMGVAVANAIDAVLAQADHVTGSNDEDGVAHFIEENILSG